MNYLIDTHILLWYMVGDNRITTDTQRKIEDKSNIIYVSNASLWKIVIKVSIGKLKLKGSLRDLKNYLKDKNFRILEFNFDDLEILLTLPFHHQDPFDRMIISQVKTKDLECEIVINNLNLKFYEKKLFIKIRSNTLLAPTATTNTGLCSMVLAKPFTSG